MQDITYNSFICLPETAYNNSLTLLTSYIPSSKQYFKVILTYEFWGKEYEADFKGDYFRDFPSSVVIVSAPKVGASQIKLQLIIEPWLTAHIIPVYA